jgi:four helix bundle protein
LKFQLKRAAVSVPTNIAEGSARNHQKEFIQFCYVSIGSLMELETLPVIAERENIS